MNIRMKKGCHELVAMATCPCVHTTKVLGSSQRKTLRTGGVTACYALCFRDSRNCIIMVKKCVSLVVIICWPASVSWVARTRHTSMHACTLLFYMMLDAMNTFPKGTNQSCPSRDRFHVVFSLLEKLALIPIIWHDYFRLPQVVPSDWY